MASRSVRAPRQLRTVAFARPSRPTHRAVSLGARSGTAVFAASLAAVALLLAGCAPAPVAGWEPPAARQVAGVTVSLPSAEDPAPGEPAGEPAVAASVVDAAALGLVGERLRNDAVGLAARFVTVLGHPEFNALVDRLLWQAIEQTGRSYAPEVFPVGAGLGDRGCVPGSTTWPADDVLARPETGPSGAAGTAITCEVTGAFGHTLVIAMRAVVGSPGAVASDRTQTFFLDLAAGTVTEGIEEWRDTAADALWLAAIDLVRLGAGGLSSAAIAPPTPEQRALAAAALDGATPLPGGGLRVTLPAGLAAPELAGLGIERTETDTVVEVDPATTLAWSSDLRQALRAGAAEPFVGLSPTASRPAVDCALLPCVALTYDDGPSSYTPGLLDALSAERAPATFYMIGGYAAGNPDTVARAAAEGHELGSHTMNHRDVTKLSGAEARAQVEQAAEVMRNITGSAVPTFRPPFGNVNASAQAAIGLPAVLWTVDPKDWQDPGTAALIERTVPIARPGGIILFHDTHADTVTVTGDVVRGLRDRGFTLVTVSDLFGGQVPNAIVRGR